jgi:hypothetical protein
MRNVVVCKIYFLQIVQRFEFVERGKFVVAKIDLFEDHKLHKVSWNVRESHATNINVLLATSLYMPHF